MFSVPGGTSDIILHHIATHLDKHKPLMFTAGQRGEAKVRLAAAFPGLARESPRAQRDGGALGFSRLSCY